MLGNAASDSVCSGHRGVDIIASIGRLLLYFIGRMANTATNECGVFIIQPPGQATAAVSRENTAALQLPVPAESATEQTPGEPGVSAFKVPQSPPIVYQVP